MRETIQLQYGDVVGVDRGFYQHYGIYAGDLKVIHYAVREESEENQFIIHISSLEQFLGEDVEYFVCDFTYLKKREKIEETNCHLLSDLLEPRLNLTEEFQYEKAVYEGFAKGRFKIYTPKETVARAYTRLGETCSNCMNSECEHFAIWCKTGIEDRCYINALLKLFKSIWVKKEGCKLG